MTTTSTVPSPCVDLETGHSRSTPVSIRFREDTTVKSENEMLIVARPRRGLKLSGLHPRLGRLFFRLAEEEVPLEQVLAVLDDVGQRALLGRCGWLLQFQTWIGKDCVRWESVNGNLPPILFDPAPHQPGAVALSRFAVIQVIEGEFVLESPRSDIRVRLPQTALPQVLQLLSGDYKTLSPLPAILAACGFTQDLAESEGPLAQWDLHDALLHTRSRVGRHDGSFGGIFPYLGQTEPAPAVMSAQGPVLPLPQPEWQRIRLEDPVLSDVMESRVSTRSWADDPMTLEELSEFLFRVARVRSLRPPCPGTPYETSSRPYPGGGASYELEFYISSFRVRGLEPGLYRYVPQEHGLELVSSDEKILERISMRAAVSTGGAPQPDAICLLGARFARVMWKYKGIAYSVILKHCGVVYQTAYLVATAMGLGVCGLGSGDSGVLGEPTGEDHFTLSAVGEFMLGRPAEVVRSSAAWQFVGSAPTPS